MHFALKEHLQECVPLKSLEAGCQLVELRPLLLLDSIVEEVTHSVHLLIAEVAIGTEVN